MGFGVTTESVFNTNLVTHLLNIESSRVVINYVVVLFGCYIKYCLFVCLFDCLYLTSGIALHEVMNYIDKRRNGVNLNMYSFKIISSYIKHII